MSKSTTITVRTDPEHMLQLMALARKQKRKLASMATILLEEGIQQEALEGLSSSVRVADIGGKE